MPSEQHDVDIEKYEAYAKAPRYSPAEVREIRQAAGLTQCQLADTLGVSRSTVYFWESEDYHNPSPPNAIRLRELEEGEVGHDTR